MGRAAIEERLARLREPGQGRDASHSAGHGMGRSWGDERIAEASREAPRQAEPKRGLEATREQLQRILEQDTKRAHEDIRERLNEALGRAKPTAREREAHERERRTQRERGHGHDDGWGL